MLCHILDVLLQRYHYLWPWNFSAPIWHLQGNLGTNGLGICSIDGLESSFLLWEVLRWFDCIFHGHSGHPAVLSVLEQAEKEKPWFVCYLKLVDSDANSLSKLNYVYTYLELLFMHKWWIWEILANNTLFCLKVRAPFLKDKHKTKSGFVANVLGLHF